MSSDFRLVTLSEVTTKIGSGQTPRGGKDAYRGGDYALIRSQNIYNDGFSTGGLAYIDDEQANQLSNVEVRPGDVLLNITGDSVARCCRVPDWVLPARVNQHVSILRVDPKALDSGFLRYCLVTPESQGKLLSLASGGATRNALTKGMLEIFEISLPPLQEQKAITHILGTLDDKIELNRKTNETLEAMAKALFKSWFVDFDPVRAKSEGRSTGLPDEISDLFPDSLADSELGEIPSGWEVARLGDCELDIESGRRPKGGIDKNLTFGIPSIGAESIAPVGQFDFYKTKWVDNDFAESSGKGWIQNFDVALYKDGGLPGEFRPRTALYGDGFPFEKAMVNEHVFLLRSAHLGQPYLYYLFNFDLVLAQIIHKGSSKGAQPGLNQEEVRTSSFVKPETRLLDAFNNVVEPSIKKQLLIGKQCQVLSQMRDALLPKLISGEIRVPDAERMLEEVGI
jgi:type I restriction enzyme S subunit